ncbi:MAG: ATP-binding protein [Bacteroidota bacterium]
MLIKRSGFIASAFFIISISLFLYSCTSKSNHEELLLKQYVQTADSLVLAGKSDSATNLLINKRPQFKSDNVQLCGYYDFMSAHSLATNVAMMGLYADSALAIFADKNNIEKYPDDYFKALIAKGDASIAIKQYQTALEYYDKAKKQLANGTCDGGNLASKIANIYFNQQSYAQAAKYWVESYAQLVSCPVKMSPSRLFFLTQSALDNPGVAYQKAGMFDSAAYYYNKDLAYINQAEASGKIDNDRAIAPRLIVYDNLGGLYLQQGNLTEAEKYLTACVSIPIKDVDGMRIPPFIKLAELYLKTGRYDKALMAFNESRRLLDLFGKDSPTASIEWNKLYAHYLYTQHQANLAFKYQTKYIALKDSVDKTNAKIRQLDVDRELNAIHRENLLADLEHNERMQKLYIIGATVVVILLLSVSLFINRVLKESRKNHKNTRLHNEQLQQALEELERANQNIIRIMRIMAHDLRNPLSGMIGLANAISDGESSDENKHMLKLLEATGIHSLEMINGLLKSGLADENEVLIKQPLDIKELLRDSVELLQFKANEKKQQIIFESSEGPIVTNINHEKIWRVFNNLIVNAIKFSYEGGLIYVSIKTTDSRKILIAIADNGMGIPDKDKDAIFEMFTPAKRVGTDGEQPFGLGLSISKRIIENHEGKLWFESSPGFGTTFYIELPL